MRTKYIDWIASDGGVYHLAIGTAAPWDRHIQIRVPKFLVRLFHNRENL